MSAYRSSYSIPHDGYPPPPPQAMQPPLPRAPPPTYDPYRDGDSYRPQPPQSDFSFRSDYVPQYPREQEYMRPTRSREYAMKENNSRAPPANNRRDNVNLNQARRGHVHRFRPNHRANPAGRPLLRHQDDDNSSEQMFGMANGQKFMSAEDVSDSDEEQMNESESDAGQSDSNKAELRTAPMGVHVDQTAEESLEPAAKRRALPSTSQQAKEGANQPKWSNPDPYTVLPPIDDARKRKDVVKLIRKARKEAEGGTPEQSQVAANDDFISFGMEEDEEVIPLSPSMDEGETYGLGVPGAPSGPRPFSHLKNLHSQEAPGTLGQTVSANSLGPPPGLAQQPPSMVAEEILLDTALTNAHATRYSGDAALGNRKRAYDDSIKGRKKGPARFTGSILREWIPPPTIDATPWLRRTELLTANAGFRLHKEICDFYDFVKPQRFEQIVREELLTRLQANVDKHLPNTRVVCFGSFAAGLYLPNADMDVVVVSSIFQSSGQKVACQSKNQMWRFANFIETSNFAMAHSVEVVPSAKVPIIKFVDRVTNLKVDVSFENDTGIIANETFDRWKRQFPAMPILVTVIKQFLMMRGLNEVQHGGLGGFSVTCLVTSLLQNMPRVQNGELIPERHLGELLIEFLDFYGNRIDTRRTGIMMHPPGYFEKELIRPNRNGATYQADKADRLAIIDPNRPSNDVSGGSREVMLIFNRFARAHNEILQAMKSPGRISLLDWSLGGNYESFTWQRNHLLTLYQERWGASAGIPDQFQAPGNSNGASPELVKQQATLRGGHEVPIHNDPGDAFVGSAGKKSNSMTAGKSEQGQRNGSAQGRGPQSGSGEGNDKGKGKAKGKGKSAKRAASFKARFPDIEGIGLKLSKKKKQKLEADRATRAGQSAQHGHLTQPIQSPHLVQGAPSAELSKGQKRAAELRATYPDIRGVPNTIGTKKKKTLIDQHQKMLIEQHRVREAQQTSNPTRPAPTNGSHPTRQLSRPHQNPGRSRPASNKMAPLSDERRAEVARNLGGTSNDNPINLD